MPSNAPIHSPPLPAHFVHTLLPARGWQDRPEFTQLCDWWRGARTVESRSELIVERREASATAGSQLSTQTPLNSTCGVCALVGIGGAGKTAIADRFLRVLPDGLAELPDVPKDHTLSEPRGLFVFSFYDASNPESFFAQLSAWLSGSPFDESSKAPSYQQTLQLLSKVAQTAIAEAGSASSAGPHSSLATRHSPLLLILDGLEKVQDDGARGGALGQLLDGRLRDLILRAADGYLSGVALLITTRFRLFDPLAQRSALYRQIDIDQLQPPAALGLLRARGACATDAQLLALAEESGFHALTLDLLGGYVAAFCDGDPARLPPLAEVKVPDEVAADDPRLAAVKEQERKFGRLAQRYREALAARVPATLALMERVCLFRLGVNADTLAAIFTGAGKECVSGPALAALNREQVGKKLGRLAQMGLLDESKPPSTLNSESPQPLPNYTVHPAVRDGFLRGLDRDTALRGHEAARRGLEQILRQKESGKPISLGGRQEWGYPSDPATLDLLEEVTYHTLAAGIVREAWDIYESRLGGFINLGMTLAEYERGHRVCVSLEAAFSRQEQHRDQFAHARYDLGLYKQALGLLRDAYDLLHGSRQLMETAGGVARAIHSIMHDEAHVLKLRGCLRSAIGVTAEVASRSGRDMWFAGYDPSSWVRLMQQRAELAGLIGRTREALGLVRMVEEHAGRGGWDYLHRLSGGDPHAASQLLGLVGARDEAERLVVDCLGRVERYRIPPLQTDIPKFQLALAEFARARGDLTEARNHQNQAHEWAIARDAKEVLCRSALVRGRIQITDAENQKSDIGGQASEARREELLAEARNSLDEGLHIARDCGYGIYHIDLLLERARLHLLRGESQSALDDLRVALDEGVHPAPDSGFPTLLAAADPDCGYAWGIAEGRHLRAQALLLRAAPTSLPQASKPFPPKCARSSSPPTKHWRNAANCGSALKIRNSATPSRC